MTDIYVIFAALVVIIWVGVLTLIGLAAWVQEKLHHRARHHRRGGVGCTRRQA